MTDTKSTTKEVRGRVFDGVVVSNKMDKTVVVKVARFEKHPKYGKYVRSHKRIKAHDANNECQIGQKVKIRETRPISKDKSFVVIADNQRPKGV